MRIDFLRESRIESAIQKLPASQVDELSIWPEAYRTHRTASIRVGKWLEHAQGAAPPGVTTAEVMSITRGDE